MIKQLLLLAIFLIKPFLIIAQDVNTIKGKVIGKQNLSPLAYCPIQLKNSATSVVTNENGDFELHFSTSDNDTLYISYTGYEVYKEAVQQLLSEKKTIFKLSEKPYQLAAITIAPPLTAEKIIENVNKNLSTNYAATSFCTKGFFREYLKVNEQYDKLMEGAIIIKSDGFNFKKAKWNKHSLYLQEVRASLNTSSVKDMRNTNNIAFILESSEKDVLKLLNNNKRYFTIAGNEYRDNDRIVILSYSRFNQKFSRQTNDLYKINTSNWAIEEYQYSSEITKEQNNQVIQSDTDSTKMRYVSTKFIFKYIPINDKYYLSYSKAWAKRILYNPQSTVELYLNTEYLTNDIQNEDCNIDVSKKLNEKESLYKQICTQPYHADFWKTYNSLQSNPEIEKVIQNLNTKGDIDEQFNNPNKYSGNSNKTK